MGEVGYLSMRRASAIKIAIKEPREINTFYATFQLGCYEESLRKSFIPLLLHDGVEFAPGFMLRTIPVARVHPGKLESSGVRLGKMGESMTYPKASKVSKGYAEYTRT